MGDRHPKKTTTRHRRKKTIPRRSLNNPQSDLFENVDLGTFSGVPEPDGGVNLNPAGLDPDLNLHVTYDEVKERIKGENGKDANSKPRVLAGRYHETGSEKGKGKVVYSSDEDEESEDSDHHGNDEGYSVRKFSGYEKGKEKLVYGDANRLPISSNEFRFGMRESGEANEVNKNWLSLGIGANVVDLEKSDEKEREELTLKLGDGTKITKDRMVALHASRERKSRSIKESSVALAYAQGRGDELLQQSSHESKDQIVLVEQDEGDEFFNDTMSPFVIAYNNIMERNSRRGSLFTWNPNQENLNLNQHVHVPSLVDLCIRLLVINANNVCSLAFVPDELRLKVSRDVCDARKMDGQFLKLLMTGSPTEVHVRDCSLVTEEALSENFQNCDTSSLRVLQLDQCGRCLSDYTLSGRELHQSITPYFPVLTIISLRGTCRLTDNGIKTLARLAPSLQSINLGQCSLLTSASIDTLAYHYGSILKQLYIDYCCLIDVMRCLDALKKFEHLEVLALADNSTVSDVFIRELVDALGETLKKLVLPYCVSMTDISITAIGYKCRKLCGADFSKLHRLTDKGIRYFADGCRLIQVLKLTGIDFSDEAIAALLEVSGSCLKELSLNSVRKVGPNTALALSKYAKSLLILDLSWCRKLDDEALGLIVDGCWSLRLLKVFGLSQITTSFLEGHSNPNVQIIGLPHLPLLKHLYELESEDH